MPRLLEESEVDQQAEALDAEMNEAEQAEERASFAVPTGPVGDLSDGGKLGRVTLYPTQDGKRVPRGRANARRAWMWDGTETVLALAWNPEGTRHDGGRRYFTKRHCMCCGYSGFRGECPQCANKNCAICNSGKDRKQNIACFYRSQDLVPFPQKFYGDIPCFLPTCVRRGSQGFKTDEDMRLHARFKHRHEYASRLEVQADRRTSGEDRLQKQVDELRSTLLVSGRRERSEEEKQRAKARMAKARAARKVRPKDKTEDQPKTS